MEQLSIIACWVKILADNILKYFSYFSQTTGFGISCKLSPMETIRMKCQILFSGENKKNISLSSYELSLRVVMVNSFHTYPRLLAVDACKSSR